MKAFKDIKGKLKKVIFTLESIVIMMQVIYKNLPIVINLFKKIYNEVIIKRQEIFDRLENIDIVKTELGVK